MMFCSARLWIPPGHGLLPVVDDVKVATRLSVWLDARWTEIVTVPHNETFHILLFRSVAYVLPLVPLTEAAHALFLVRRKLSLALEDETRKERWYVI